MKHPFNITGSIELEKNGEVFLNAKRLALLKLVKEKGSINAASKEMKMSYQQAWHFIQAINELAPLPLIVRKRGGSNGGGASLTSFGEKTIREYEEIIKKHQEFCKNLEASLWLRFF